jgi:hypothetical protein
MRYAKSLAMGVVGAFVVAILWILVSFVLPVFGPMVMGRLLNDTGMGSSGMAAISDLTILLAAVIGFVIGCWYGLRRFRSRA